MIDSTLSSGATANTSVAGCRVLFGRRRCVPTGMSIKGRALTNKDHDRVMLTLPVSHPTTHTLSNPEPLMSVATTDQMDEAAEDTHSIQACPALPQELVDAVLEIVVRSQHHPRRKGDTVAQCMLVSRSFLTSVRRYLFEHITIRDARKAATLGAVPPSETARMEGLLAIFRSDPLRTSEYPLVAHVRSIKMVMDSAESKAKEMQGGNSLHKDASSAVLDWNARRVNMREVLRAVTHLERFALEFMSPISGHSIHVGISLAIEKVCQSSLLTRLEFANIYHFPVDLLASCTNLRYLRLLNVHTGDPELDGTGLKRKRYAPTLLPAVWGRHSLRKVEVLETENSGDVLEEINRLKAASGFSLLRLKLKSFKLGLPSKAGLDSYREVAIMLQTAPTLESLTIRGISSDISINLCPGSLSLSDLKVLRHLNLHINFPSMSLFGQMPPCLDSLLGEHVHSPTSIETITFDVTVKVSHFNNSKFTAIKLETDPAWATIDHHLTNGSQYPVLRQVNFRLLIYYQQLLPSPLFPGPDSWEEMKELKSDLLANLQNVKFKLFQAVAQSQRIKYDFFMDFSAESLIFCD